MMIFVILVWISNFNILFSYWIFSLIISTIICITEEYLGKNKMENNIKLVIMIICFSVMIEFVIFDILSSFIKNRR